jgi:PPM family protein phosphatase
MGDDNMTRLTWGQATIGSSFRDGNQDSLLTFYDPELELGLFIVADGMGGKEDGAKAAQLCTQIINKQVMDVLPELKAKTKQPHDILVDAFQMANREIINVVVDGAAYGTAVLVDNQNIYVVHVGCTRACLITDARIDTLTQVHDLVHRLIELGRETWDTIENSRAGRDPYRALGQNQQLKVDLLLLPLLTNACLLVCSYGLFYHLNEPLVEKEIHQIVLSAVNPQKACDLLVENTVTKSNSHHIDTSVIVVRIED